MKRFTLVSLVLAFIIGLVISPGSAFADFDQNKVIDDEAFVNSGAMTTSAIQLFLSGKNSVLAGYSEGGRTAAQIIADAANANGISPQVLLAALQREQGLISLTSYNTTTDPDGRLRKALGYACPDSGSCDSKYAGFTNQVDGAAFQFRYNYDGSTNNKFSGYQVGSVMTFDGIAVTLSNRATASLYRYTPHVSGERSFFNYYFSYFVDYSSHYASQNGYPTLAPGDSYQFKVAFQNIGNATWTRDIVKLGTDRAKDRISMFSRENRLNGDETMWMSANRVALKESSVPVNGVGNFNFYMTVPNSVPAGTYREYFRPVAEGLHWLDDDQVYWDVKVANHQAAWDHQNAGVKNVEPGQSFMLEVGLKNTGETTWRNDGSTPVRLGTSRTADRTPVFLREDSQGGSPSGWTNPNRISMVESRVAPGGVGTFKFWYTVPGNLAPGTYREYFQPVHENVRWMNDLGIYFDIVVGPQKATYLNQSSYPTLSKGQSAKLTVQFRNDGATTWTKNGNTPMRLGTLRAKDRVPTWIRDDVVSHNTSGWINPARVSMVEDSVPPGGTGTFSFWITVPGDKPAGTYREYFGLVQDNYAWLPDPGLFWDITVN